MKTRIIILNGTSSSGKSTLASHLRRSLPSSFCFYSSDMLADGGFRQLDTKSRNIGRRKFFDGFHSSIYSFALKENDLLIEHIIEQEQWFTDLNNCLQPFDVFWVGVKAPLDVLQRRELNRGNRSIGEAEFHLKTHDFCQYDCVVDTTNPIDDCVTIIIEKWNNRINSD